MRVRQFTTVLVAAVLSVSVIAGPVAAGGVAATTGSPTVALQLGGVVDGVVDTAQDAKSAYNNAADSVLGDTRDEVETGALALGACAASGGSGCALIGGTYVAKHAIDDDSELS